MAVPSKTRLAGNAWKTDSMHLRQQSLKRLNATVQIPNKCVFKLQPQAYGRVQLTAKFCLQTVKGFRVYMLHRMRVGILIYYLVIIWNYLIKLVGTTERNSEAIFDYTPLFEDTECVNYRRAWRNIIRRDLQATSLSHVFCVQASQIACWAEKCKAISVMWVYENVT